MYYERTLRRLTERILISGKESKETQKNEEGADQNGAIYNNTQRQHIYSKLKCRKLSINSKYCCRKGSYTQM